MQKRLIIAGSALLVGALSLPLVLRGADAPAASPASQAAPTTTSAKRTPEQIMQDIRQVESSLRGVMDTGPDTLTDKAKRDAAAPKVIPVLKKTLPLLDELEDSAPQGKVIAQQIRPELLTLLSVFGDQPTIDMLKKQSEGNTPEALSAKIALINGDWIKTAKDEPAQAKVIDQLEALAKANPKNMEITQAVAMASQFGGASPANTTRVENILLNDLSSPMAAQMKEQIQGRRKMQEMVNKPINIEGTKVDGSDFKSADWKGKVILVDFWATWCGPCKAELPRVKDAYSKYHEKGLEVLGVSCDSDKDALQTFVKEDPAMAWPQLFDAKQNPDLNWHPLAKAYGINAIPTMFLIDKKGVLRSVTAREDFETEIPKLLAE